MLTACLAVTSACAATVSEEKVAATIPAKVLFVGNSFTYYNNSLHNHFRQLMRAANLPADEAALVRSKTISGGYLPEHEGGLQQMLSSANWDVVVLQGHSKGPISPATAAKFRAAARDYSTLIREHGAEPVFFMTWAYSNAPEMTATLDKAYTDIGNDVGARVVPVGLAFEVVTRERPELQLRTDDRKHPTLAGTYLAACTFYAALTGRSPANNSYTATLAKSDASYLQRVAWQTVAKYRQR